jgi:hypothetical protein
VLNELFFALGHIGGFDGFSGDMEFYGMEWSGVHWVRLFVFIHGWHTFPFPLLLPTALLGFIFMFCFHHSMNEWVLGLLDVGVAWHGMLKIK